MTKDMIRHLFKGSVSLSPTVTLRDKVTQSPMVGYMSITTLNCTTYVLIQLNKHIGTTVFPINCV